MSRNTVDFMPKLECFANVLSISILILYIVIAHLDICNLLFPKKAAILHY